MENQTVSIIIPAYNAQKYLRECLDSVLNLAYKEFECIVVNDGSTDETEQIASVYALRDSRFKVITTENKGVSAARNTGIDNATGEWITFVDSDDCLTRKSLNFMIHAATETNSDIVVACWRRNKPNDIAESSSQNIVVKDSVGAIMDTLYENNVDCTLCGKIYKKNTIGKERFDVNSRYEDLDWFYRVYERANKIAFIPDVVYFYRDNPQSFMSQLSDHRLDVLEVTRKIEDYYTRGGITELVKAARDRRLAANFNIFGLLTSKTGKHEYVKEKNDCWNLIKRYRMEALRNHRVCLKNKIGVIVSLLGRGATTMCSKLMF